MKFSWDKIQTPFYCLAPMAGVSNSSFRLICRSFGADVVFSEMISADGIIYGSQKTIELMKFRPEERPYIVQIFGNEPIKMAEAIKFIEKNIEPDGIDINMGCPAKKVSSHGRGAALLKDFEQAKKIASTARRASKLPLSVKMRLGWEEFEIHEFVKDLEKIGIDALTIHARTKVQGFKGNPAWKAIRDVKRLVQVPVIGNGDVTSLEDDKKIREVTNCDGVMIGRGALGRPWLFREIKEEKVVNLSQDEIIAVIVRQLELTIQEYGSRKGLLEMRKFFSWYLKGFKRAKEMRNKLMQTNSIYEALNILQKK